MFCTTHRIVQNERILDSNVIEKMMILYKTSKKQNKFAEYDQQDATFHNFFISVRRFTCFRRFFRTSSGDQNCTYSVKYVSDQYCYLLLAWLGWNR